MVVIAPSIEHRLAYTMGWMGVCLGRSMLLITTHSGLRLDGSAELQSAKDLLTLLFFVGRSLAFAHRSSQGSA